MRAETSAGPRPGELPLRGAVVTLYAEADIGPGAVARFPTWLPKTAPAAAIETIRRASGPLHDRALRLVAVRLAAGAATGRSDLRALLVELLGSAAAAEILDSTGGAPPAAAEAERRARAVVARATDATTDTSAPVTRAELDPDTMVTTITVEVAGRGDIVGLARYIDPQNWGISPYWTEVYKAIRGDGGFRRDPDPPPLGRSWRGYFFERVEWGQGAAVVCSFENYLNIDFTATPDRIDLEYSLYDCRASRVGARVEQAGLDVDSGHSRARPLGAGLVEVRVQKRIRFSDLLSRRTSCQGAPGSGQLLNYTCPGVLAWWMDDVVQAAVLNWISASLADAADPEREEDRDGGVARR